MFRFIFSGKLHPAILHKAVKAAAAAISEHEQKLMELCTLPAEEALQRLGVTENGLSDEQVETARKEYGSNILSHRKEAGIVMELLQRCRNPLVIQLLVICVGLPVNGRCPRGDGGRSDGLAQRCVGLRARASLQQGRGKAQRHGANQLSGDARRKRT